MSNAPGPASDPSLTGPVTPGGPGARGRATTWVPKGNDDLPVSLEARPQDPRPGDGVFRLPVSLAPGVYDVTAALHDAQVGPEAGAGLTLRFRLAGLEVGSVRLDAAGGITGRRTATLRRVPFREPAHGTLSVEALGDDGRPAPRAAGRMESVRFEPNVTLKPADLPPLAEARAPKTFVGKQFEAEFGGDDDASPFSDAAGGATPEGWCVGGETWSCALPKVRPGIYNLKIDAAAVGRSGIDVNLSGRNLGRVWLSDTGGYDVFRANTLPQVFVREQGQAELQLMILGDACVIGGIDFRRTAALPETAKAVGRVPGAAAKAAEDASVDEAPAEQPKPAGPKPAEPGRRVALVPNLLRSLTGRRGEEAAATPAPTHGKPVGQTKPFAQRWLEPPAAKGPAGIERRSEPRDPAKETFGLDLVDAARDAVRENTPPPAGTFAGGRDEAIVDADTVQAGDTADVPPAEDVPADRKPGSVALPGWLTAALTNRPNPDAPAPAPDPDPVAEPPAPPAPPAEPVAEGLPDWLRAAPSAPAARDHDPDQDHDDADDAGLPDVPAAFADDPAVEDEPLVIEPPAEGDAGLAEQVDAILGTEPPVSDEAPDEPLVIEVPDDEPVAEPVADLAGQVDALLGDEPADEPASEASADAEEVRVDDVTPVTASADAPAEAAEGLRELVGDDPLVEPEHAHAWPAASLAAATDDPPAAPADALSDLAGHLDPFHAEPPAAPKAEVEPEVEPDAPSDVPTWATAEPAEVDPPAVAEEDAPEPDVPADEGAAAVVPAWATADADVPADEPDDDLAAALGSVTADEDTDDDVGGGSDPEDVLMVDAPQPGSDPEDEDGPTDQAAGLREAAAAAGVAAAATAAVGQGDDDVATGTQADALRDSVTPTPTPTPTPAPAAGLRRSADAAWTYLYAKPDDAGDGDGNVGAWWDWSERDWKPMGRRRDHWSAISAEADAEALVARAWPAIGACPVAARPHVGDPADVRLAGRVVVGWQRPDRPHLAHPLLTGAAVVGVRRADGSGKVLWERTLDKPTRSWQGETAEHEVDVTARLGDGDQLFVAVRAAGIDARDFAVVLRDELTLTT